MGWKFCDFLMPHKSYSLHVRHFVALAGCWIFFSLTRYLLLSLCKLIASFSLFIYNISLIYHRDTHIFSTKKNGRCVQSDEIKNGERHKNKRWKCFSALALKNFFYRRWETITMICGYSGELNSRSATQQYLYHVSKFRATAFREPKDWQIYLIFFRYFREVACELGFSRAPMESSRISRFHIVNN